MKRPFRAAMLVAFSTFVILSWSGMAAEAASRPPAPYCLRGPTGSNACLYQSLAQCRAAALGTGATCRRNPRYGEKPGRRRR